MLELRYNLIHPILICLVGVFLYSCVFSLPAQAQQSAESENDSQAVLQQPLSVRVKALMWEFISCSVLHKYISTTIDSSESNEALRRTIENKEKHHLQMAKMLLLLSGEAKDEDAAQKLVDKSQAERYALFMRATQEVKDFSQKIEAKINSCEN